MVMEFIPDKEPERNVFSTESILNCANNVIVQNDNTINKEVLFMIQLMIDNKFSLLKR